MEPASHDKLRVTQNTLTQQCLVPRSCQSVARVSHVGSTSRLPSLRERLASHDKLGVIQNTSTQQRAWRREVARVSHEYHTSAARADWRACERLASHDNLEVTQGTASPAQNSRSNQTHRVQCRAGKLPECCQFPGTLAGWYSCATCL